MLRPTELQREYDDLLARLEPAEKSTSPDCWIDLYERWNRLSIRYRSEAAKIVFEHQRHMSDPDLTEKRRVINEELTPICERAIERFSKALLRSVHRDAASERFGHRLVTLYEMAIDPLAPVNEELRLQEVRIVMEYMRSVASSQVEIGGEQMPLMRASSRLGSPVRDVRQQAFEALAQWREHEYEGLAALFDQLVTLRQRMARNLGDENFIRLGYLDRERVDYTPDQVLAFCNAIARYATPIRLELQRRQRESLGLDRLRPWDAGYDPMFDLPPGTVPVDRQQEYVEQVLDRVDSHFADNFRRMRQAGLVDLESRPDKFVGAFAVPFHDIGLAGICSQSNGDVDDMRTLFHEVGHCMQIIESMPIESIDLRSPSSDGAEIHSHSMEFLALRHAGVFLEPNAADIYRRNRWRSGVQLLISTARADLFQHWVYRNPDSGVRRRQDAWTDISDLFATMVDSSGYEDDVSRRWTMISHLFATPFYLIDYAAAETVAMQLAMIDAADRDRAVDIYRRLCRMGGTRSFNEMVSEAGLRSPFDPSLLRELMVHSALQLDIDPAIIPQ